MMRIGWLCWGEGDDYPQFREELPRFHCFVRTQRIVYAEVVE